MKGYFRHASITAMLAALAYSPAAFCQTENPQAEDAKADATIGDIVVTAQRRSENLQKVPISVTAISMEQAQDLNIRSLPNIQLVTPGMSYTTGNDYAMVYIRGVGANFSNPGVENPVGVYVDGAYNGRSIGGNLDIFDSSSIQVLKGPQGTLWGRNATGGAILVTTSDPVFKTTGQVAGEIGNQGHREVEAIVNVPLSNKLAIRVSGRSLHDGGYMTNLPDGASLGWINRGSIRAKVLYKPTDDLRITAYVQHDTSKNSLRPYQQGLPNGFCSSCRNTPNYPYTYPLRDPYTTTLNADFNNGVGNNNWSTTGNLTVDYATGIFNIKSVSSYNEASNPLSSDFDYTVVNALHFWIPFTNKTFFQNLTLSTDSGGRFDGIAGVEYLNDKNRYQIFLVPNLFPPFPSEPAARINTESFSAFGELTFRPTDKLKIVAGGRYTHDNRTGLRAPVAGVTTSPENVHQAFNSFVPRFVVSYDAGALNLYASYNEGTKAGGISSASTPFSTFEPERLKAFEAGVKYVSPDRRLRFNLSAFHYDYQDIQTQAVDNSSTQIGNFQPAQAKINGVDVDGSWHATPWLELFGGGTYLHARYSSFRNAGVNIPIYDAQGRPINMIAGTEDLTGTPLPKAPDWTAFLGATLSEDLGNGWKGRLTGLVNYSDWYYFFPGGSGPLRFDRQDAYATARLSGSVTTPDDRVEVGFYVENLTNKLTYDFKFSTQPFGDGVVPNRPRQIGLRVAVKY